MKQHWLIVQPVSSLSRLAHSLAPDGDAGSLVNFELRGLDETRGQGDKETRRQGDKGIRGQGDKEDKGTRKTI